MTSIRVLTNDKFLSSLQQFDDVSYQQTPYWSEARRVDWPEYEPIGWYEDGPDPISIAMVRYRRIPGTTMRFAFIPFGPLIDWHTADIGEQLGTLRNYLADRNVIGVRMIPYLSLNRWDTATVRAGLRDPAVSRFADLVPDHTDPAALRLRAVLRDTGWIERTVPDHEQMDHARFNFRLDLDHRSEEDVLAGMQKTWRYNAKKAGREGIEVDLASSGDLEEFHRLWASTGARNGFTARSPEFLRSMWAHLGRGLPDRFTTHLARLDGQLLGASTTVRVTSTAKCIYTATDTSRPKAKPSNAIYLTIIRQLIAAGAKTYDLGVVKDCLSENDHASGLVRFKAETGADAHEYVGEWELPIAPRAYAAVTRAMPVYVAAKSRLGTLKRSTARLRFPAAGRPQIPAAADPRFSAAADPRFPAAADPRNPSRRPPAADPRPD